jgi:hypothetical protein
MAKKINFFIFGILSFIFFQCSGKSDEEIIRKNILNGNYEIAQEMLLNLALSKEEAEDQEYFDSIRYEIERLDRIKMVFTLDSNDVLEAVRKYVPGAKSKDLKLWVQKKYLEAKPIEGEMRYYKHAVENLFRVHPELKAIKQKTDSAATDQRKIRKYVSFPLSLHIERILQEYKKTGKKHILPVTINVVHTAEIDSNVLPDNEIIKCWLPFPREIKGQQYNVKRITSNPHIHVIAENDYPQRTIFLQNITRPDTVTKFMVEYEFTTRAVYNNIKAENVTAIKYPADFAEYVRERPPHIIFNQAIEELSKLIVGDETNPYLIAKKIFTWIDQNIDWAVTREYSTIRNLCLYPFYHKQGDAGVQSFLFMTLCRYNKIPARLVSGWQFQPPTKSLHDWCEIYLEPYGWVPVDVTYGIQDFPDDKKKYFYLGNIDSYRLVFNQDYGTEFNPAKEFFRSDIIDNQRGEMETMERNLYFDKWTWNMEFEIVSTYK